MIYQKIFLKYKRIIISLIILSTSSIVAVVSACNPYSDNVSGMMPTGLHHVLPPFSNVYHREDYRFPAGNCDEANCHGPDLTGGNSGSPSCYKCHNNLWNVFQVSHTVSLGGYYHHYEVGDGATYTDTCKLNGCHGDGSSLYSTNLNSYDFRYACHSCHPSL